MVGAQIILRCEDSAGTMICSGFNGLPLSYPALIEIRHAGSTESQSQALSIADALRAELLFSGATQTRVPCGTNAAPGSCHATSEPLVQKLLVIVSDGSTPFPISPTVERWLAGDDTFGILPILPYSAKTSAARLLPTAVGHINAEFWHSSPDNVLPAIFSKSGITNEQSKIFISYRQIDSAALAIQLFDALSHEGFDVFLDHFRIAPGVNFQARLTQELGNKAMVLLLETEKLLESEWVTYEINTAKTCGLGVLALNINSAPTAPGVDSAHREAIDDGAFVDGSFDKSAVLLDDHLGRIVQRVKTEHDRNLLRRRQILERSLEGAVLQAGGAPPERQAQGCFEVKSNTTPAKTYLVWLTPRPPELPDFHHVHSAAGSPARGVILGLSRLMEPRGQLRYQWLAGIANVSCDDEGQLLAVASEMVRGSL